MRITKFGHACVRIEHEGAVVVLDPGGFTQPDAIDGATAVLITHEHADHYDAERLRRTDAPIFTIEAVAAQIRAGAPDVAERVTVVTPGQQLDAAAVGIPVTVVGEKHAIIHPDLPHFDNSGYLMRVGDVSIYHPGDSLTVPEASQVGEGGVDLLLAPISGPWLKVWEAVDFVRAVGAPRILGIHDKVYSEVALTMIDGHMGRLLPETQEFVRRPDGADL